MNRTCFLPLILMNCAISAQSQDTIRVTIAANHPKIIYIQGGKPVPRNAFTLGPTTQLAISGSLAPYLVVLKSAPRQPQFNYQFGATSNDNVTLKPNQENEYTISQNTITPYPKAQTFALPLIIQVKPAQQGAPLIGDTLTAENTATDTTKPETHQKITSFNILTRIPFYDAFSLAHPGNTPDTIYQSIIRYYFSGSNITIPDSLHITNDTAKAIYIDTTEIAHNPFLGPLADSLRAAILDYYHKAANKTSLQSTGAANIFNLQSALGSVAGLDVTNIAQGVADLMIKRAKQELTIAFFDRFKTFVKENPEIQVLFPKTTSNLNNLLSYKYPDMLNVLRKGFIDDLDNICFHLDDVLELPRYKKLLKDFPEVRIAIRSIRLVQELEQQRHPADVLSEFAAFREWTDPVAGTDLKNFGGAVKTANLLSLSLRDTGKDNKRAWVRPTQLDSLIIDTTWFNAYMALVYETARKSPIYFYKGKDSTNLASILADQKNNIFLVQNNLTEFIQLTQKVQTAVQNIKAKNGAVTNDDYYNYINTSIDVIEYAFGIINHFDSVADVSAYTKMARQADDLYRNIYQKQYPQAITNSVTLLTEVIDMIRANNNQKLAALNANHPQLNIGAKKPLFAKTTTYTIDKLDKSDVDKIDNLIQHGNLTPAETTAANVLTKAPATRDSLARLSGIMDKINKYGLLAANMASATTPDQVSSVLDNAILPVGSSSLKKNATWNLSVQSYLGAYLRTGHQPSNLNIAWNDKFGVTAPIGLSFSYGLKKGGAFGIFTPLFDLGAIVDYDLKKDSLVNPSQPDSATITRSYKVKLGQIFSPGVYVVYSIGANLPLALGFGAQYGPGLGKINVDNTTSVVSPQWRYNFFLAVDLPFFTIINHQRSK